jgi:hypothetical protein
MRKRRRPPRDAAVFPSASTFIISPNGILRRKTIAAKRLFRKLRIRRNVFTAPLCEGLDGQRRSTKETAQTPCPCLISTRILIYRRRQFLRTVGRVSPRHPQIAAETCLMWPRRITPTMRPPPTRLRWPSECRSFLGKDVGQLRQWRCVHAGLVVQESSAIPPLSGLAQSLRSDSRCGLWRPRPSGRPMASGTGCKSCIPVRAENWMEQPDRQMRPGHASDP